MKQKAEKAEKEAQMKHMNPEDQAAAVELNELKDELKTQSLKIKQAKQLAKTYDQKMSAMDEKKEIERKIEEKKALVKKQN